MQIVNANAIRVRTANDVSSAHRSSKQMHTTMNSKCNAECLTIHDCKTTHVTSIEI